MLSRVRKRDGREVPFDEAMDACEGLIVNVEIKNSPMDPDFDPDDEVAADVISWLHEHGWAERVIVSSFNPATVDRARQLSGAVATGQVAACRGHGFRRRGADRLAMDPMAGNSVH